AHQTLRYRRLLGAEVNIFADVDSKHSAPLAARELAIEVEELISRGCADAIVVTGPVTGKPAAVGELKNARKAANGTPVIAGSGVEAMNVAAVLESADGVIVGTGLKRDRVSTNPVDGAAVREFMDSVRRVRRD